MSQATTVSAPTIRLADILNGSIARGLFVQENTQGALPRRNYELHELLRRQVTFDIVSTSDTLQVALASSGLAGNTANFTSINGVFEPTIFDFHQYASATEFRQLWRDSQRKQLLSRINEFQRRVEGWDGSGGTPPNSNAIRDAKAFLLSLAEDCAIPSKTFAPGDGEVIFQWRQRGAFVEVGFYGDGTISWYARTPRKEPLYNDNPFTQEEANQISADLLAILRALA